MTAVGRGGSLHDDAVPAVLYVDDVPTEVWAVRHSNPDTGWYVYGQTFGMTVWPYQVDSPDSLVRLVFE